MVSADDEINSSGISPEYPARHQALLGIAWLGLVVAELMGSSEGVGYMIMDARQFSQTNKVFVGIIIFAAVGKLTDALVRMLERKLLKWRNSYEG